MVFGKQRAILYVHKNGITFYINNQIPGVQFDFSAETVDENLEVLSEDKLRAQLATFLKENNFKPHTALVLLSGEVVLQQDIVSSAPEDQRIEAQKFYDQVPFKDTSKMVYKLDGRLQAIATNKTLYTAIITLLSQYEWEVTAVIPIRLFGDFAANDILNAEDIQAIEKNKTILKQGNLLTESELPKDAPVAQQSSDFLQEGRMRQKSSFFSSKPFFIVFLIILFLIGLGAGSLFLPWRQYLPKNLSFANPTPTPTTAPSPTQTVAPVTKDQLKIKVLNGTGTAGDAGKAKTALTNDGYKTIDTGNADTTDSTTTTVVFDESVSQSDRDGVTKDLESIFANVSGKTGTPTSGYNIEITTGPGK